MAKFKVKDGYDSNATLILSSSATSNIHISGTGLSLGQGGVRAVFNTNEIAFTSSAAALFMRVGLSAPYFGAFNSTHVNGVNNDMVAITCGTTSFMNFPGGLWRFYGDTNQGIAGHVLEISGASKANTKITAVSGHLILSSSTSGSVITISGAMKGLDTITVTSIAANGINATAGNTVGAHGVVGTGAGAGASYGVLGQGTAGNPDSGHGVRGVGGLNSIGSPNSFAGDGVQGVGGAAAQVNVTGGMGGRFTGGAISFASGTAGHGTFSIGGNATGFSSSAGHGIIAQGGNATASGSIRAVGVSGSGGVSGSAGWFVGGYGGDGITVFPGTVGVSGTIPVVISGTANVSASIVAKDTHLILSSSGGSRITVSGAFTVMEQSSLRNLVTVTNGGVTVQGGSLTVSSGQPFTTNSTINYSTNENVATIQIPANFTRSFRIEDSNNRVLTRWNTTLDNTKVEFGIPVFLSSSNSSGSITAANTHLILSSSAGSIVTVSGTLNAVKSTISGSAVTLTVRATTAGNAIEGYGNNTGAGVKGISDNFSGAPGIYGSGVIGVKGEGTSTGSPGVTGLGAGGGNGGEFTGNAAGAGLVAIAGGSGQALAASGSIKSTTGLIYADRTHLILSSSVGSRITISGNLKVGTIISDGITAVSTTGNGITANGATDSYGVLGQGSGSGDGGHFLGGETGLGVFGGGSAGFVGVWAQGGLNEYGLYATSDGAGNGGGVQSEAAGSGTAVHGESFDLNGIGIHAGNNAGGTALEIEGNTHIIASGKILYDSDLIFSSTAGSIIAFSGVIKHPGFTSASLPSGNDNLSGSIVWVSDLKFFAGYGPEGWTKFISASF